MNKNTHNYPEWHPEDHEYYKSEEFIKKCDDICESLLKSSVSEKTAFILDTRNVHRELYSPLCPEAYPEYAGTYRGTTNTSLAEREVRATQLGDACGPTQFLDAKLVEQHITQIGPILDKLKSHTGEDQLFALSQIFYIFGLIHPYLDGNGHVQRIMFLVGCSLCSKLSLRNTWTIHPRPYDIEMAEAFNKKDNRLNHVSNILRNYVDIK